MSKHNPTYSEYMAEEMRNTKFAQEFILVAVREGDSIEEAVRRAVENAGVKEFSKKSGIDLDYLSSFVRGEKKISQKRLEHCLSVFDLQLTVTRRPRRKVA